MSIIFTQNLMILKYFIDFVFVLKRNCQTIRLSPINLFILLGFNLMILIVLEIFENLIMFPEFNHGLKDEAEDIFKTVGFFLIFAGFITPLLEEFIFRYFLVGNDFRKVIISIFFLLVISLFDFSGWDLGDIINLICFIYFILVWIFVFFYKNLNPKIIIYSSIFLFGIYHLPNYQYVEIKNNLLYVPVLILPQIILGYFLVFFRVNFGLIFAIIYHALYNTVLLSITYFLFLITGNIY